ncbi:hypothetical protein AAW12_04890 [Sphingobacterium sp. Ag1]|uniref:hypothetical protein n=1 Tax=Sphingobacterium sp. Ag1 TaxID=1643451 RepID=UPI00062819A2|nr:hypothetical protein [Sphingobacterium sp. Ag1]KKO92441.1 hypothetical protein AAW12_04890 [Sphingobacterium sp. Ag1]
MKKIFNKIGQVLQLLLASPVKLPGKVGNALKYLALGLGIVETVLDEAEQRPEVDDKDPSDGTREHRSVKNETENTEERSAMDESE